MREIKFRAWDKEKKRMTTTFNVSSQGIVMFTPLGESPIYLYNYILMQYTGLKDKTGKEIYEGDIVKETDGTHSAKGVVYFSSDGLLGAFLIRTSYTNDKIYDARCLEVIGNIYENKDLLNETK